MERLAGRGMRHSSGLKRLLFTADAQARGAVAAGAWQTPGAAAGQALGLGLLLVPVGSTHSGLGCPATPTPGGWGRANVS